MSFLTPWFLAGVALVAGPIIAHLIRRATRDRLAFSTLRFLDTSAPRLDRRSRVQHPWLLALRCLIVAVLAFGFARPFLRDHTPPLVAPAVARHVVAVLDESASMQRAGSWDAARSRLRTLVSSLRPADRFALLAAGNGVTELVSASQWGSTPAENRAALVRSVLESRRPGWGPTPLDSAAEAALARWEDMAESDPAARRELVLVSDFAAGSRLAGFAHLDWPPRTEVVLQPVTPALLGNASLHWLGWSETDPARPAARIRVSRTFDAPEALRLQWRDPATGDPLGDATELTLLPGASEVRLVPLPENAPPALRLDLVGDEQLFDNTLWLVRSAPREIPLVYLGPGASDDPKHTRFYLERAIAGWRDPAARLQSDFPAADLPALFVVAAPLDAARTTELRARLESGSFALVLLDRDDLIATAAALAGEPGWSPAPVGQASADALLGYIDFQHPLFAPFADPLYSDFTRVRFWQPSRLSPPPSTRAAVVARFDDDSPAVIETAVGRGRLVVWCSGWSPAASQWVLSSKFVPWLQALAERAAGGGAQPAILEIGDPRAPATVATPGIHESNAGSFPRPVALNVPATESQTEPLPLDTWEQLGVPLRGGTTSSNSDPTARPAAAAAVTESRQQLWRWLLWLAVALLATESLLSLVLSRRQPAS